MRVTLTPAGSAPNPRWLAELTADLRQLADLLEGMRVPVYLVGGVGMALRAGGFARNHRDLDIAVFVEDLGELARHLRARGMHLVHQVLGTYLSPWHRLQVTMPLDWDRVALDPESLHLRALRPGRARIATAGRTGYFDVFLLGRGPTGVALHGYGRTVPHDDFFPADRLPGSTVLHLPCPRYKQHLPPTNATQHRDIVRAGLQPLPGPDRTYSRMLALRRG